MDKKIIVAGTGGHGVKLLMGVLAELLKEKYFVSLYYEYDSAVRGGKIFGFLSLAYKKIDNPIIENADIFINLTGNETKYSGKLYTDLNKIDFIKKAEEKFKINKVANMIILGYILNKIKIKYDKKVLGEILPDKFKEMNMGAIEYGYEL